jgi:hypothetical protein
MPRRTTPDSRDSSGFWRAFLRARCAPSPTRIERPPAGQYHRIAPALAHQGNAGSETRQWRDPIIRNGRGPELAANFFLTLKTNRRSPMSALGLNGTAQSPTPALCAPCKVRSGTMSASKRHFIVEFVGGILLFAIAATVAHGADIRRAAATDSHMAIYAHRNPEREAQREYMARTLQIIKDERIVERIGAIVESRVPADKLAQGKSAWQELQTALAPVNWTALTNAEEYVVVQAMVGKQVPTNNTLVAVKMSRDDAEACQLGVVQLLQLIAKWTGDDLKVETRRAAGASFTVLEAPPNFPFQPAVARFDDLLLVSTHSVLLEQSLAQLQDASLPSKFDDPRLKEGLSQLPPYEDSLMFLDGRQLFGRMREIASVIEKLGANDPGAKRAASLVNGIVDQVAILDYQVRVEYTQGDQVRTAQLVRMVDGYRETLLGRAVSQGKPIEDWRRYVPADAIAFSFSSGISLHEVYHGVTKFIREQFPESQPGFEKFARIQENVGLDLDRDILQAFSGEFMSVTVPVARPDGSTRSATVFATKCQSPDKIRDLISRGVEALAKIPAVQAQQLKLVDSAELPGFAELQAAFFPLFGVKPVFGFTDGWMVVACQPAAVEKVLAVRAGTSASIADSPELKALGLDVSGPILAANYSDVGAQVRRTAEAIDGVGAVAPMFVGMIAAKASPEDMKTMQEAVGLLPSLAKVVRTMDFFGHKLNVTWSGPLPNSLLTEAVLELKIPSTEAPKK